VPGGLALRSLRTAQRAVGVLRDLCARLSRLCDHLDVCGGGCNVRTLRPVPGHFPCGGQGICLGLRTGAAACERNRLVQPGRWLAATRGERGCWSAVGSYRTSRSLLLRRGVRSSWDRRAARAHSKCASDPGAVSSRRVADGTQRDGSAHAWNLDSILVRLAVLC